MHVELLARPSKRYIYSRNSMGAKVWDQQQLNALAQLTLRIKIRIIDSSSFHTTQSSHLKFFFSSLLLRFAFVCVVSRRCSCSQSDKTMSSSSSKTEWKSVDSFGSSVHVIECNIHAVTVRYITCACDGFCVRFFLLRSQRLLLFILHLYRF